jgi:hypothetical protein
VTTTVNASSPDKAVKALWANLSKYILGNVPNLYVTIREEGTKNLHHYNIQEKVNDDKQANISYKKVNVKLTAKLRDQFLAASEKALTQQGGAKKRKRYDEDDSSSDDSDSDDEFHKFMKFRKNNPISYYWYTPKIYYGLGNIKLYTPVWRYPVLPYNEIWIPMIP